MSRTASRLIMKAMLSFGQNWQAVSERVPGRSAHAVRNRFLRELRGSTVRSQRPHGLMIA